MSTKKLNCWEFMKCQREPGGASAAEKGVCVAAMDSSYGGINDGKNAGRICWAVAGTCCGGEIQGTFAEKRDSCTSCSFYRLVQEEEDGALGIEASLWMQDTTSRSTSSTLTL